jgi:hypothetical protein
MMKGRQTTNNNTLPFLTFPTALCHLIHSWHFWHSVGLLLLVLAFAESVTLGKKAAERRTRRKGKLCIIWHLALAGSSSWFGLAVVLLSLAFSRTRRDRSSVCKFAYFMVVAD